MKKQCDYRKLTTVKKQYFINTVFSSFMYSRDRKTFVKFFEEHIAPVEKEEIRKKYTINLLLIIRYLANVESDGTTLDLLYMFDTGDFSLLTKSIDCIMTTDKHISVYNIKQLEEMQDICLDYIRNKDAYNKCPDEDEILF